MRHLLVKLVLLFALTALGAAPVHAGPNPSQKCQASKLRAAGTGCDCRFQLASQALRRGGGAPDFSKCHFNVQDAFAKANDAGGCPITGETPIVNDRLVALFSEVSAALGSAGATDDAAVLCAAAKLKAAGKMCACIHKTQAIATQKGAAPSLSNCEFRFDRVYAKAEAKAGGACPTVGDVDAIGGLVDATLVEIEADVADRDTATFIEAGPYGVGMRTATHFDSSRPTMANGSYPGASNRTLVTSIWYPMDPAWAVTPVVEDAAIIESGGPFPLIILAHGFSGSRTDSSYLVRHFASRGYVVVAPDFPLSSLGAPGGPTFADVGEQARDLSFLIDTYTAENGMSGSFFFGRIDTSRIGAIGHSLGGTTVLLATYHGSVGDPRIKATVALSPLACLLLDGFFGSSSVPLMIQGGTVDMITPYTSNQLTPYGFVNAPKYLFTMTGGTHLGFSDRILFDSAENGDDAVGCSIFVGPGDPQPMTFDPGLPPDYLGGPAAFVDPSGSSASPSVRSRRRASCCTRGRTISPRQPRRRSSTPSSWARSPPAA